MKFLIVLIFLLIPLKVISQQDSIITKHTQSKNSFKKIVLPVSLIIGGSLISNSNFEKEFQDDIRKGIGKNVDTQLDDFLRYAPMTELAIANIAGLKAKNHWFDQAKNLFIINLASFITVRSLKSVIDKPRPNNQYIFNSFPSGHTTFSFSNAALLYYEYKDNYSFFAYSGYGFATTTASFRLLNDRHWLADVVVGAGIGILITHLVYIFEPLKNWNPFLKSKDLSFIPIINSDEVKLQFSWRF